MENEDVVFPKAFRALVVLAATSISVGSPLLAQAALPQANPFVPGRGVSQAYVDQMIDAKMKAMEDKLKTATPVAPGKPGSPAGGPGAAPGSPAAPGTVAAPGAIDPYGSPEKVMMAVTLPSRAPDIRFVGCINGEPKFVRTGSSSAAPPPVSTAATGPAPAAAPSSGGASQDGERVSFTKAEIKAAINAGILPACR